MRAFNVILAGCVWFLAGCASHRLVEVPSAKDDSAGLKVPLETSLNPDAGRGNLLVIHVSLEGGKELPFVLDTGAGITCVGKSLASKLGRRVGTVTAHHWGQDSRKKLYAMPAIYLEGARLRGGKVVMALDLQAPSLACGEPIAGILGMDVLENYCVQMDFAAHTLRLLDDSPADKSAWGRAFPLMALNDKDPRPAVAGNLFGEDGPH